MFFFLEKDFLKEMFSCQKLFCGKSVEPFLLFFSFFLESPYFLAQPEDVVTVAGSDIVLDCQVGGEPVPEVRWTRQGNQVIKV